MTLDEAIQHCKEVEKEKRYECAECMEVQNYRSAEECNDCAEEHKQLAEWLTELKQRREAKRTGYWYYEKKNPLSYGACKCSECGVAIACRGQVTGPDNLYCRHCGSKNSDERGNMIFRDQEVAKDDR
jgi:hypothetical protein